MTMMLALVGLLLIAAIATPVLMLLGTSNRLVKLDARCDTAFADIDVHMKHRHDLIPGLVEIVRGYAAHERDILIGITEARAQALAATSPELRLKAEKSLSANITSLMSMADRFPELKASSHFTALRNELADAENRITASRRFYNLAIEEYNATLRQFPGSTLARIKRMGTRRPFDLGLDRLILDEPVAIKF